MLGKSDVGLFADRPGGNADGVPGPQPPLEAPLLFQRAGTCPWRLATWRGS
jgi:hypothetical protein